MADCCVRSVLTFIAAARAAVFTHLGFGLLQAFALLLATIAEVVELLEKGWCFVFGVVEVVFIELLVLP